MSTQLLAERYELRDTLGTGGMARVLEGYDRVLDRRVAVKLLREDAGGPQSRERFLREARAAASFHHPNAVAVFDTGRDDGTPFIVMELVDGATLADELDENGRLDQDRALDIAEQVLAALAEAHRRGLVHRDVKPANIMLPRKGEAKLTDFGIAKSVHDSAAGLTLAGQVFGTPKYLSPEQVNGQAATPRSDVYALGVVLYEMLAGEPPFTGDNAIAIAIAHTEDEPPRLDRARRDVDPTVAAFVHRALEKDPLARFGDAAEMREALGRARAGTAPAPAYAPTQRLGDRTQRAVPAPGTTRVVQQEPGAAPPHGRRRGGHLWLWLTVAALLLLGLVLGGAWVADRFGEVVDPAEDPAGQEPAEPDEAPEEPPDDPADEEPPAEDTEPPTDEPADEAPSDDPPAGEPDPPAGEPDPPAGEPDPPAGDPDPPAGDPDPPADQEDPGQAGDSPGQTDPPTADPVGAGEDGPGASGPSPTDPSGSADGGPPGRAG